MTTLLYTTRAITGGQTVSLLQNMSVAEKLDSSFGFMNHSKNPVNYAYINSMSGLKVLNEELPVSQFVHGLNNWKEWYELVDVSHLAKYDRIVVNCGLLSENINLQRSNKRIHQFVSHRKEGLYFESTKLKIAMIIALLKLHREFGIPYYDMVWDPEEANLGLFTDEYSVKENYYAYHGYDIPRYGLQRLDSYSYWLNNTEEVSLFDGTEKTIDFVFGGTFTTKKRKHLSESYQETASKFGVSRIYVKDRFSETDTTISKEKYLAELKKSRFTLAIPSYDVTCMSIYRIQEALHNDCLPLIHPLCQTKELEDSFNTDLKPLIFNSDSSIIPEYDRLQLLEHYKKVFLKPERFFNETNCS
jgi:hypothetical protein